jgi:hypothetical protein
MSTTGEKFAATAATSAAGEAPWDDTDIANLANISACDLSYAESGWMNLGKYSYVVICF